MARRSITEWMMAGVLVAALAAGGVSPTGAQVSRDEQPKPKGGGPSGSTGSGGGGAAAGGGGGGGGQGQSPPGQDAYRAPTIVALLRAGAGVMLARTKSPVLKLHFDFYLKGFALSMHQACPMLSGEAVEKIQDQMQRLRTAFDRASEEEKKEVGLIVRSAQSGINDGKIFVARNACATEAARTASKDLLEIL